MDRPCCSQGFRDKSAKGAVTLPGRAGWDDDAAVWVADSDEVPGLVTEAETVAALIAKRKAMIPELLALHGVPGQGEVAFETLIRRSDTASRAAAAQVAKAAGVSEFPEVCPWGPSEVLSQDWLPD